MIIKYKDLIGDSWTLLSATIIQNITPINGMVLNGVPFTTLSLIDFEGGLYTTWKDKQGRFICVKNNDDDEYFFIGRVAQVEFDNDTVIITMVGGLDELTDNEAYEVNYILAQGIVASVDSETELTLTDSEGAPFTDWANNRWVNNRDVAAIMTDLTVASSQVWHEEDVNPTHSGWDSTNLNGAKCLVPNNGLYDEGIVNGDPINNYFNYELGGVDIPNSEEIEKITIKCRIGAKPDSSDTNPWQRAGLDFQLYFWNYNSSAWDLANTFLRVLAYNQADEAPVIVWSSVAMQNNGDDITNHPEYFLHDTGDNFDYIKVRILVDFETGNWSQANCYIDFLEAEVFYQTKAFSPYMKKITANGESDITCAGATFQTHGISVGDQFQIGENTTKILTDILQSENMTSSLDTNLDKYMARHFKGVTRKLILKSTAALEGADVIEFYIGDISNISFYRSANFPSPSATFKGHTDTPITEADYDAWKLRRPDNAYDGVKVYGNAFNAVEATAGAIEGRIKKIIDDSIKTKPDAQEVADAQYAILGTLRPSYQITLFGDTFDHLRAGMNVYVTFARPAIIKTEYPIRSIMRSQGIDGKSGIMMTVIELGLGATTDAEELAKYVAKSIELSDSLASNFLLPGSSSGVPTISHTNLANKTANDHHTKYTNANAVSAVATADDYIKNDANDITSGDLKIAKASPTMMVDASSGSAFFIANANVGSDAVLILGDADLPKAQVIYDGDTNELSIETYNDEPILLKIDHVEQAKVDGSGLDVTGDITVSGTVDGVDIAARDHAPTVLYEDSDVENVITAEIVEGESIDNAIDNLITAHKDDEDAHGMEMDDLTDIDTGLSTVTKSLEETSANAYPHNGTEVEGELHWDENEEMLLRWSVRADAWIEIGGGAGLVGGNSTFMPLSSGVGNVGHQIEPSMVMGFSGFVQANVLGGVYTVARTDVNAVIAVSFNIVTAGTYKCIFRWKNTAINDVINGQRSVCIMDNSETPTWDEFEVEHDLTLTDINVSKNITMKSGIVLDAGAVYRFNWIKTADDGVGNIIFEGAYLERTS